MDIKYGGKIVTVPDGLSNGEIEQILAVAVPPSDEMVYNTLKADPARRATPEEFDAHNRHDAGRETEWGKLAREAASGMFNLIKEGLEGAAKAAVSDETTPAMTAANAASPFGGAGLALVEAFLRGNADLGLIAHKAGTKLANWLPDGVRTKKDRLEAFNANRQLEAWRQKVAAGGSILTDVVSWATDEAVDEFFTPNVNKAIEAGSTVTDLSMFVPATGVLSGASKLAVAAPIKGVGKAVAKTAGALEHGINVIGEFAEAASKRAFPDLADGAIKGGLIPTAARATAATVRAAGEIAVEASENFLNPTRSPAFSKIAKEGIGPRALIASVARPLQPLADVSFHAASGALEGAVIGGVLGYASDGADGAAMGIGGGALLGVAGAGAMRVAGMATGSGNVDAINREFSRFVEVLPESERVAASQFGDRLSSEGNHLGKAALMDMAMSATRVGKRVIFVDNKWAQGEYGTTDIMGVYRNRHGEIAINVDKADVTTAPHEFLHFALKETLSLIHI